MDLDEQFRHNPTIDPKTGQEIQIGSPAYKRLVTKYGEPYKVRSPKSDRLISIGKGEYNKLVASGYTFEKLKHGYQKESKKETTNTESELVKRINFHDEHTQKEVNIVQEPTVQLTGIKDTDLKILRELSAYELANLCTASKYIRNLCKSDKLITAMISPIIEYVYHSIVPKIINMHNVKVKGLADKKDLNFEKFCLKVKQDVSLYYKSIIPHVNDQVVYANKGLEIDLDQIHQNKSIKLDYFEVLTYCQILYLIAKKLTANDTFIYFGFFIENMYLKNGKYVLRIFTLNPGSNKKQYIK